MSRLRNSMSTTALLLTMVGMSAFQQCPVWREISPCTCHRSHARLTTITCDKMASYAQVVDILGGHFNLNDKVSLQLSSSNLQDLHFRTFKELNASIENLKLNHDYLGPIDEEAFDGLNKVTYISLSDTVLEKVPQKLWRKMPSVKTLDLGRSRIKEVCVSDFKDLPHLDTLLLPGNHISRIDQGSFPQQLKHLHLGRNQINDLNITIVGLTNLEWLFINSNDLENLEDQLPIIAPNLVLIHAAENKIKKLPQQLRNYPALDTLFFQENRLTSLDGAVAKSKMLIRLVLEYNNINTIRDDDFQDMEMLESLVLGHNQITTLNNSLLPLRSLNYLNMTFNLMTEFSFQDVMGLQKLRSMDLSFNQISTIIGPNLVEWNIKLTELMLDHNLLETLNGALSGLPELLRLNLSFNKLRRISPDDFIGLDQLRLLDISHNQLTTLEETSRTYLPRLSELRASYNNLTILEKDFHGLPVLCHADLSNNNIIALGRDLVTKTRCKIEHGVHEGTWDTLKIYLQDNPILCDAAMPEITSAMEINHTRIYGVSHCAPLSEQPVTAKPNGFLGYIPEQISTTPSSSQQNQPDTSIYKPSYDPKVLTNTELLEPVNQIQPNLHPEILNKPLIDYHTNRKYNIETLEGQVIDTSPINITPDRNGKREINLTNLFDPISQGQQINKLASEIAELKTRIDHLSSQNQLLLNKTMQEQLRSPKEEEIRTP